MANKPPADSSPLNSHPATPPTAAGPKPTKPRRGVDLELQALAKVDKIIADLPAEQARRCVWWLSDRYARDAYTAAVLDRVPSVDTPTLHEPAN